MTMKENLTLQRITPAQRRLVELMLELNFGQIEILRVIDGEPCFDPPPRIVREFVFGKDNVPGPDSNQTGLISGKSQYRNLSRLQSVEKQKKKEDLTPNPLFSDVTQDVRPVDEVANEPAETETIKPRRHRNKYRPGDLKVEIVYVPTSDYEERKKRVIGIMADCILRDLDREAMKKLKEQEAAEAENVVAVPQNGNEKKEAPMTNQVKPVSKKKKVPAASDVNVDKDFIQETIDFWEKKTGKKFTREDARQMIENVSGYFNTLHKWDMREKEKKNKKHT